MAEHSPLREESGFTLIEVIVFIVIVSVGLAGVLAAFNTTVRSSGDPMINSQILRLAEATMQEVLQKQYQNDPSDPANGSSTLGGTTPVSGLGGYSVAIAVDKTTATLGGITTPNVKKITVTASNGSQSIVLTGYRTNYGY